MLKNKIHILLTLLLALIFYYNSIARVFTVGGGIGFGSPVHPVLFQDYYRQGTGYSGVLKFNFLSHTSIVLNLSYQPIQSDLNTIRNEIEDRLDQPYYVKSLESKGFVTGLVSLNILQYFQENAKAYRFYITAGGGYGFKRVHKTKMQLFLGYADEFEFDPKDGYQAGINGGLGLEIGLNDNTSFYIQGLYHYLFTEDIELYNPKSGMIESIHDGTSFVVVSFGFLIDF